MSSSFEAIFLRFFVAGGNSIKKSLHFSSGNFSEIIPSEIRYALDYVRMGSNPIVCNIKCKFARVVKGAHLRFLLHCKHAMSKEKRNKGTSSSEPAPSLCI
jgi:hypothetical protein